jgi:hypothetical protein
MKMLALALGIWGLGATSAAALTYDLNRPLVPRPPAVGASIHVSAPEVVRQAGWDRSVLTIAPITIVSHRIARPIPVATPQQLETLPDISRMHCADWRDLQMGSGRVQTCE